jgi:hypothetical protein
MQSVTRLAVLAAAAAAACASAPRAAAPAAPAPRQIALDRHVDVRALAELATRTRGNCDALATELGPLVARMKQHVTAIRRAQLDPALAKQLTTELRAYDVPDRGLDEQIGSDLAQTYLGCKQNRALLELIDQIPAE